MEILDNNRKIIEEKYADILKKIEECLVREDIKIEVTSSGQKTITVERENTRWYLNSRLNPENAASVYAERYELRLYGIYYIFGMSDGRHVREILKKCDKTNKIVVCEPDFGVFCTSLEHFDISDILKDERVILYIPEVTIEIRSILTEIVETSRAAIMDFFILPGYDILHKESCESYMDSVIDKIRDVMVHKGTYLSFQRMIPQHTFYHMKQMISQRNQEQLRLELNKRDLSNVPAIIVSAGPSLDKNVHELKKAQGKAFIIVVDAAIRTVIQAGIRPDMICTIDPESPDRFVEGLNLDQMNWACMRMTRPEILNWKEKNIFYYGVFQTSWDMTIRNTLGYDFPDISSGGSVSSEAFMLAHRLGFRKMILVGQDMAFTGGVSHTKGINEAFGDNDEYIKSRNLVQVEGNDGTMLETDFQMWYYLKWFERVIKDNKTEFSVINATEGGAKIEGTEVMTLNDAIARECKESLDVYSLARNIPQMFTEEQQKELNEELEKFPEQQKEFMQCVEKGILKQQKLLEKMKTKSYRIDDMKKALMEVLAENEQLGQQTIFDLITVYAKKEEYEVSDDIYAKEDMGVDDLLERNLILLEGYKRAAKLFEEDFEEFVYHR